jgi:hypothetical protein
LVLEVKSLKLTPVERQNLLYVIPKEGSVLTLRIVRDLQTALGFTEAEHKEFVIKMPMPNGSETEIVRADKCDVRTEVRIGEKAEEIIVEALKALIEKKQLHITCLGLYERFVEKKKTAEDAKDEAETAAKAEAMKIANADLEIIPAK